MKRLVTAIAITLFAASAGADDVYRGLAKGSGELNDEHPSADRVVGVQSNVGNNIYQGFGDGSGDLFQWRLTDKTIYKASSTASNIYLGFCGTTELMC